MSEQEKRKSMLLKQAKERAQFDKTHSTKSLNKTVVVRTQSKTSRRHPPPIPRSLVGIPAKLRTWIRSMYSVSDAGITETIFWTFQTNDLLNTAIAPIQSLAAAGFSRSYSKYRVEAYKYKAHLCARTSGVTPHIAGFYETGNSVAPFATATDLILDPSMVDSRCKIVMVGSFSNAPNMVTFKGGRSISQLIAHPENREDDNYAGTVTIAGVFTAPADLTYLHIGIARTDGVIFVVNTCPSLTLIVDQHVCFYEPRY